MPTFEFETSGLTPYVVFVEGMVPVMKSNRHIDKVVMKGVSKNKKTGTQEVSFYLYYGAADSNVGVAIVTVIY